jgi:hypothetical protein
MRVCIPTLTGDPVLFYTVKASSVLGILLDASIPGCLAYFFRRNPAPGPSLAHLAQLGLPQRMSLFLTASLVELVKCGIMSFTVLQNVVVSGENPGKIVSTLLLIMFFVSEAILTIGLTQVVGGSVDSYQGKVQRMLEVEKLTSPGDGLKPAPCPKLTVSIDQERMQLLTEYKNMKRGLGPLLFLFTTVHMIQITAMIYIAIKSVKMFSFGSYLLIPSLHTLNSCLVLFYLVEVCDDCHNFLSDMKESIRYRNQPLKP